ncbi:tetratricopeptide repeat protein [Treponema phagedenis]|uniref:Cyclic nucleotide-binding domain protein n=1 Tax=Treponema phagedenis TaxID=162 RepID=A0A0B7H2L8_TREPH|nr:cyclic nucleotide-binding domain-containing protein [Treponema phagedenis]EFW37407.1 cyclic nucleotide-binding domain protein [Treponema phagedenis F0421]NVP23665.1 cyclic nucleotide-binding domain-containing protein [Treponema phagedenis]QEJ94502.1 cyclic nucleotide-binding domain-containing protein [Treponema phagedenis]QEJ98789.1 cyclic nucleotide-binding domain-containing protein [Treponema phagedenis]QEK04294.1 cyclic nucleotide-binding domain-containing protein [Treponema phagedenis]
MPKAVQYKANSVIYFSGDFDDRVFLLNKGHIALTSINIETGAQVTEYIKTGEFFGVKSALGNYPREESAMVLTDSIVYTFTGQEFEAFAQTNTRIIMKMIKVFSRQLRTIHRQLETLLDSEEETDSIEGLFTVASAFYNSHHYQAAGQVAKRYQELYPHGKHSQDIAQILKSSREMVGRSFGGAEAEAKSDVLPQNFQNRPASSDSTASLTFKLAEDLAAQKNWKDAYIQYHSVIETGTDENIEASYIGAGHCLYEQREYVRCLQLLTNFITQHPKSLKLAEALMYIGLCYRDMKRPDKALQFFDKALLMAGPLLVPKIKELQAACEGVVND